MNILFIKHFLVGFMVADIPRVSVFGHCQYSITLPYRGLYRGLCIHMFEHIIYFLFNDNFVLKIQ